MMCAMFTAEVKIECLTCPATGTTACGDCVVTHLLANDAGPIDYTPIECPPVDGGADVSDLDRAIELFAAAGLLDDPPILVQQVEFERAQLDESVRGST
jgi:hypothetical protein